MEMWRIVLSLGLAFAVASEEVIVAEEDQITSGPSSLKFLNGNNLEDWVAPVEYQKAFGYYWSGFDEECRPIWISDMGKWDARKFVQSEESLKNLRKYILQAVERIYESLKYNNSDCYVRPTEIIGILDADNYQYLQLASPKILQFVLDMLKDLLKILLKHVHKAYIVNTNYVAEGLLLIARPVLGEFMASVEVYGTQKSSWLPKLLKILPWDQLPTKFGGKQNFQPLKIYG